MQATKQQEPLWRKALALVVALTLVLGLSPAPLLAGHAYAADGGGVQLAGSDLNLLGVGENGTELSDGTYTVAGLESSLGMYRFQDAKVVVNGDNAWLITTTSDEGTLNRYDGMAYGKFTEIVDRTDTTYKTLVADTPTAVATLVYGEDGETVTNRTFALPVPKSVLESGDNIYYTLRYSEGYSDDHSGDWYITRSGFEGDPYYFSGYTLTKESDSTAVPGVLTIYELKPYNNEGMYVVVKAVLEDYAEGQDYLTYYLNSSSYKYGFGGTQDEAVAQWDFDASAPRVDATGWAAKANGTISSTYVTNAGVETTLTDVSKLGYRVPVTIPEGQTRFDVPIVAYATDFTARNFAVDLEALTATTGSASDVATLAVTSSVADVAAAETGSLSYTGYIRPYAGAMTASGTGVMSNDWVSTLTVNLGGDAVYDQAYAVTYQGRPFVDMEAAAKSDPVEADYAAVAADGTLALPLRNEYDTDPKTVQLNGNKATIMMHVAEGAPYEEAGTWVERTFQLDFTSRTAATLAISGDALTPDPVDKFAYDGDAVSFIKEDGSAFGMLKAQDGTAIELVDDDVVITYVPKNTTTYTGFYLGGDNRFPELWSESDYYAVDGDSFAISLPADEYCGYAWPVAVVKADKTTTPSAQYYLAIPTRDKIAEADYSAVDAAIASVPADLSTYTDETAAAVMAAVNAVERGKKAVDQAAVDAMAQAIEDAIAMLVTLEEEAEAEGVADQIAALPEEPSAEEVAAVREAYDALTEGQKALVDEKPLLKAEVSVAEAAAAEAEEAAEQAATEADNAKQEAQAAQEAAEQAKADQAAAEAKAQTAAENQAAAEKQASEAAAKQAEAEKKAAAAEKAAVAAEAAQAKAEAAAKTAAEKRVAAEKAQAAAEKAQAAAEKEAATQKAAAESANEKAAAAEKAAVKTDLSKAKVTVKKATYTGKALKPAVTVKLGSKTLKKGTDYTVKYVNNKKAGKGVVVIAGKGSYTGAASKAFTIAKAKNTVTAKAKKVSLTAKTLKKKAVTLKKAKAFKVAKAKGTVTFKKASGNKKIAVASNGKVTVKKGLKAGTYKVKVKVTAKGNANFKKATKTVTLKVVVK